MHQLLRTSRCTWRHSLASQMVGRLLLAMASLVAGALAGRAMINPDCTPVDLVRQADIIQRVQIGPLDAEGNCPAKVVKTIKGQPPATLAFQADMTDAMLFPTLEKAFGGSATASALMFAGDFSAAAMQGADAIDDKPVGALHLATAWFALFQQDDGSFRIGMDPLDLKAVWAGADTMLEQAIEYITTDATADIPTTVGVTWGSEVPVGVIKGEASGCAAVDLFGDGKPCLFVLSAAGDRAFRAGEDGQLQDVTAQLKVTSRSKSAVWADFNNDGRLDMASTDGLWLYFYTLGADNTFTAAGGSQLAKKCVRLSVLDTGRAGQAGLLLNTTDAPVVLASVDGKYTPKPLPGAPADLVQALGDAGPCVAGDFDGDGLADVAQVWTKGLLLYHGKGGGEFAAPVKACGAGLGSALFDAMSADFDANGQLDLLVASDAGCSVLTNVGGGKFVDTLAEAGEISYISKPNTIVSRACDINNDGRQDVALFYQDMAPQLFFNRGFRCFGHAIPMELSNTGMRVVDPAMEGQQAGTIADLNGDGAEDLAMVTAGGQLWVLYREAATTPKLGVTVALTRGAAGPVRVVGYEGQRCLGARCVTTGEPAFFGKSRKGPLVLKWQQADGSTQERTVVVLKSQLVELTGGVAPAQGAAQPAESKPAANAGAATPAQPAAPQDVATAGGDEVLNDATAWRFLVVYRPSGASPEKKAWARWVRAGDECESPLPPQNWAQADFDDVGWPRREGSVLGQYGNAYRAAAALVCTRTRFGVTDPAKVKDLALSLAYRGGVVVYVNGKEVGRGSLPAGKLDPLALAEEYPEYVLVGTDGRELQAVSDKSKVRPELLGRYEQRIRTLTVRIPAEVLKSGANVLALELHSAKVPADFAGKDLNWNTAGLMSAKLTAAPGSPVQANVKPVSGVQVWTADPLIRPGVDAGYGDPFETVKVELRAPINGISSGQAVVSSSQPLKGITGTVSDLKSADGSTIPASAIRIRYARVGEGAVPLLDRPDAVLPNNAARKPQPEDQAANAEGVQPIWLTVRVPADAKAGTYTGTLQIQGLAQPVNVPVELTVFGWKAPDPKNWRTWVNLLESPESVAGYYQVPLWSDEHFRLLEKSFQLMGDCGNDLLGVNAVAKTVFGDDPLIVFRRQNGAYVPDFRYLDRYLALYGKYAGAPKYLSVQVWHYGMSQRGFGRDGGNAETYADTIPIMELVGDELVASTMPMYGKPGTEATWKLVMDGVKARVQKLGWKDTRILVGTGGDNWPGPVIVDVFRKVAPYAQWRVITHGSGCPKWGATDAERTQPNHMVVGYLDMARRIAFNRDRLKDVPRTTNARDCCGGNDPFIFRSLTPTNVVNARFDGFGWKGLDYWTYRKPDGTDRSALNTDIHFGNVVGGTPRAIAAPGPDGAVATQQYEALREGVQDAEAVWFIWDALDNPALRRKLGDALAKRAEAVVAEVGDMYELGLRGGPQGCADVRTTTTRLHETAAEVARAIGAK